MGLVIVNLAKGLGAKPKHVIHCLKTPLGEKVKTNDLLASKRGLFSKREILSPVDGQVERLEEETGLLFIKEEIKAEVIEPKESTKPKALKIKAGGRRITASFVSGKCEGELIFLKDNISYTDIRDELRGKIVAGLTVDSQGVIHKASALELRGLVLSRIEEDLQKHLEKTGGELGISVVVLPGADKEFLENLSGKKVSLDQDKKELIIT